MNFYGCRVMIFDGALGGKMVYRLISSMTPVRSLSPGYVQKYHFLEINSLKYSGGYTCKQLYKIYITRCL